MSGSLVMIPLSLNPGLLSRTTPRSVYGAKPPSIAGNGGLTHNSLGCWTYKPHQGGWLVIKDTCNPEHQKVLTEWKNWFSAMFSEVFVAFVGNGGIGDLTHNPMAKCKPHQDSWLLIVDVSHLIIKTTEADWFSKFCLTTKFCFCFSPKSSFVHLQLSFESMGVQVIDKIKWN